MLKENTKSKKRGVLLCPLPFYHIYGMTAGLCVPLYAGAKLVSMSAFDLARWLELVQKHKVTRGHIVPPIALALAKHPIVDKFQLGSLECLMSGAAPLGAEVQAAAAKRLGCIVKQVRLCAFVLVAARCLLPAVRCLLLLSLFSIHSSPLTPPSSLSPSLLPRPPSSLPIPHPLPHAHAHARRPGA